MKIRTITCHDVYNLGASLQAYALQHYLEEQGHDVKIIDYKPDYLSGHYRLTNVDNPIYDKPIIKQLYLAAKLPCRLRALKRKHAFDDFTSKYLHLTPRYNSCEELQANAPEADVYIAGSDQIWNTIFPNGKDAAFYLEFGNVNTKRISYAASFATPSIATGYEAFVAKELKNFDAISIREKSALQLLSSLGRTDGVAVCDPVFLHSKAEWQELTADISGISEKFVLVYLTDRSKQIEEIAKSIKKHTGWKILVVGAITQSWADRSLVNAGPLEFVRLINDAQYVISNSFHATAFSLIFEKTFCVVNRAEGINERMKSVLDQYGLSQRLVSKFDITILNSIDYNQRICQQIQDDITRSKHWLNACLSIATQHLAK